MPSGLCLDFGAGRGKHAGLDLRGVGRRICGVDPDPVVVNNPLLDEAKVMASDSIPYGDQTFQVVYSLHVLEHVPDPNATFQEVRRVLVPGGSFLFLTPNKHHYAALASRLTPYRFHVWVRKRLGQRAASDTFSTFYRANSVSDLRSLARTAGLEVERLELIEPWPGYLAFSAPTYFVGIVIERMLNRFRALAGLRGSILGILRRP